MYLWMSRKSHLNFGNIIQTHYPIIVSSIELTYVVGNTPFSVLPHVADLYSCNRLNKQLFVFLHGPVCIMVIGVLVCQMESHVCQTFSFARLMGLILRSDTQWGKNGTEVSCTEVLVKHRELSMCI